MATFFWDASGIVLIDYLEEQRTITGAYYANLMRRLHQSIVEKRRGKLAAGVVLLHDNAAVHTSQVARAAIRDSHFTEMAHPPYSPDLAPSDYHLFPKWKKQLRGRRFHSKDELKDAVED